MSGLNFDFIGIWTVILGFGIILYVVLDGFDLGVGILYEFAPDLNARNIVMNSIAPIWDGNETWLVLGGFALLAAFPLAFAIILPAVYFPLLMMLLGLVFRGLAFEFRFRDREHKTFWDYGFSLGSAVATFAQGIILGAFIQGFKVEGRSFSGSSFDCFTPFTFLTGAALLLGYSLLGSCWLIIKTDGKLQDWARDKAKICLIGVMIAIAIVSLWTPLASARISERWFSLPNVLFLVPIPILTGVTALWIWRAIEMRKEFQPFFGSIILFLFAYAGIAISLWPMIVPPDISLTAAASSPSTQAFLLVGTLFLIPIILVYSGWSYWVFRGKIKAGAHYT
jgi:cytochrome bd ubiquinol oxidase subunit II